MKKYTKIPKKNEAELAYELYDITHKDNIRKGVDYEKEIFKQVLETSASTKTLGVDNKITYHLMKNHINKCLESGYNYYNSKFIIVVDGVKNEIDGIFIENGVIHLVEIKKHINNDTTHTKGLYNKTLAGKKLLEETNKNWKVKTLFVGFEDGSDAHTFLKLANKYCDNEDLNVIGGKEFCDRLGINYVQIINRVQDDTEISINRSNIFKKYSVK